MIKFSNKFGENFEEDPLYRILKTKKYPILDFTISNPTKLEFNYSYLDINNKLSKTNFLEYSPNPKGSLEARISISEYYKSKAREVNPENIFLTSGTSEAVSFLFKLFCNPGDTVLSASPGYPLFDFLAELENIKMEKFKLIKNKNRKWNIDFSHLKQLLKFKPKILLLVQPSNPTGTILQREDILELSNILNKNNILLIVDEVFSDYIYSDEKCFEFKNTPSFYLNGISKTLALPQMKLGWTYHKNLAENNINNKFEIITDSFLSVNSISQNLLPYLLNEKEKIQTQIKNRIQNNIQYSLNNQIKDRLFDSPSAGWYGILNLRDSESDEEIAINILEYKNLLIHPGYMFDFEETNKLVFSLLLKEEIYRKYWIILKDFLELR
ncbi:MAG: pyridoxal phosphate-dependent aminotransferase [Leptospiraceae bacterium]|nr:pyridoxal phosphate-dependent aminotransferase [Leptospiraceae bacterium]